MGALVWKVSVNGQVYDADFETLKQWVAQGSVGPTDQIYKEGMGWLEARSVPVLRDFFAPPPSAASPPPSFGGPTYNQSPPGYDQGYGKSQYPADPYAQSANPYGQPANPPSPYAPGSNPYAPPSYPYAPAADPYASGYAPPAPAYGSVGLGLSPYSNYGMPPTAGLGKRFLGNFLDGLVAVAFQIPGIIVQSVGQVGDAGDGGGSSTGAGLVLFGLLLRLGGFVGFILLVGYLTSKSGASLGKKVVGTQVLDETGQFLSFGQSILREFLKSIFGAVCFLVNLWLLFDKDHQQLYDKVIRSNVYET
jgi:uncharacterized RDD family membrane protein YckC